MQIVFVHGWGFNASIWKELISHLPQWDMAAIDLGFIAGDEGGVEDIPEDAVIIGHSLGVMWSLKHLPSAPRALISICGFDRFSPPIARKSLELMKRGIGKRPEVQMHQFWNACGIAPFAPKETLNGETLLKGLDWLMHWDARAERQGLTCPVLALAARDDKIVSQDMSNSIWTPDQITWSDTGGHALPMTRPSWCAEQIRCFLERNE